MGKFFNRLGNTIGILPRTAGTGIHAVEDVTKTSIYGVLDPFEGLGKTAKDIKTAINNACTTGKRYQKLWKAPASLIASPFMAIEGVGETIRHTGCNIFRNIRDSLAHPFINIGHGIKRIGSAQDVGSFSFEKIKKESTVSPKMKIASRFM